MKYLLSFLLVAFSVGIANAQDDLLNQLDSVKSNEKEIEMAAFKGVQICNMQSTKLAAKGEWYMVISHRFGDLTEGFDNFFGLDNALTKFGGLYGVTNWLTLGASRHTYNKIYELTAKYKMANQEIDGFPVTIVGYNTMDINSALGTSEYPDLQATDRFAFTTQLLVSRKFSEKFSFELAPIYVHKNLYDDITEQKDLFLVGAGARYKIAKRLSINLEYAARIITIEGFTSPYHNPLTVGLDIETGGHVFQLVVSNSQPMNDVTLFSNTSGDWNGGSIYFGFNMYRSF
jgi:opacity protein-like surface antigen